MARVDVYVCPVADARGVRDELPTRVAPVFADHARSLLDAGTKPAETGALCELISGALVAAKLGVTRDELLVFGPYGKPSLTAGAPFFNLSHSENIVILGICDEAVGVDVQPMPDELDKYTILTLGRALGIPHQRKADPSPELMELAQTPADWARNWTRVEAVLKAIGTGFGIEPPEYLPLMDEWQCAWGQVGADMICVATRTEPEIVIHDFDLISWIGGDHGHDGN